ncbi:MAG: CoA-binding protein [Nitrospira sp.]|nr:CoA-binding protein [Nitrospira sp.]
MTGEDSQEWLARLIRECRTIAVVGLSSNPARPSYRVAAYMQRQGKVVVPVTPREPAVLGERAYPALSAVSGPVDMVNIFRRSEEAGAVVDEAIRIKAKAVWLQEGVIDEAAAERARRAGLQVVMDRCWLKEHIRCVSENGSDVMPANA